jgi:hypothetical protein
MVEGSRWVMLTPLPSRSSTTGKAMVKLTEKPLLYMFMLQPPRLAPES